MLVIDRTVLALSCSDDWRALCVCGLWMADG